MRVSGINSRVWSMHRAEARKSAGVSARTGQTRSSSTSGGDRIKKESIRLTRTGGRKFWNTSAATPLPALTEGLVKAQRDRRLHAETAVAKGTSSGCEAAV